MKYFSSLYVDLFYYKVDFWSQHKPWILAIFDYLLRVEDIIMLDILCWVTHLNFKVW